MSASLLYVCIWGKQVCGFAGFLLSCCFLYVPLPKSNPVFEFCTYNLNFSLSLPMKVLYVFLTACLHLQAGPLSFCCPLGEAAIAPRGHQSPPLKRWTYVGRPKGQMMLRQKWLEHLSNSTPPPYTFKNTFSKVSDHTARLVKSLYSSFILSS